MRLEYLFLDTTHKEELSKYSYSYSTNSKKKGNNHVYATTTINEFENSEKWTLLVELSGENEISAKHLSIVDQKVQEYSPIILTNDSSAYFNKSIYPLANEFERKLRKLLYLKSTLHTGEKPKKIIEKLEEKDFGEIYDLLFVDKDFYEQFKRTVTSRASSGLYYTKKLSEIPEKTVWDVINGVNNDDFLKQNFLDIIDYRNDAMHAHNISYEEYRQHKNTSKKAIEYLDSKIMELISYPISEERAELTVDTLYDKLFAAIREDLLKTFDTSHKIYSHYGTGKSAALFSAVIKALAEESSFINQDDEK